MPIRSKLFGRVAAVEGAAEFLVEHGWVDDGNKIVFQGSSADVVRTRSKKVGGWGENRFAYEIRQDRAVATLEEMGARVARKKERACSGLIVLEGGLYHGSSHTWDEWRAAQTTLYHSWISSLNHRCKLHLGFSHFFFSC